jgi:arylsulfatase A-like enzyme
MTKRPNLLFIMTDQQKATSLDLYNTESSAIETKALRMIAEEGVIFDASYCAYPLCSPSRMSMLTGIYPSNTGLLFNNVFMEDKYENVFSAAKQNGYKTMLIGKDHAYAKGQIGGEPGEHPAYMDSIFDQMYLAFHMDYQPLEVQKDLPDVLPWFKANDEFKRLWGCDAAPWDSSQSISARMCEVAEAYIREWDKDQSNQDQPFAMWLSFPDPHEYYQAPYDVVASIDPESIELPPNWQSDMGNRSEYIQFMHWFFNHGGVSEAEAKKLIRIYLAMCKNVDMQLEKLFSYLKQSGIWENTLIIFTSDHGDFNGEHQLLQKFNAGYDGCCRVPLLVALPGKSIAGRRFADPVNLADLPSTICELMGWNRFARDQGRSLVDVILSPEYAKREYTVVESGVPGDSLTLDDIRNFPEHRYDAIPQARYCYNAPHRFSGKMYAVRSTDYKLIVRQGQKMEFYDMRNDPWEQRNIGDDPMYQAEIVKHYHYLTEHLAHISARDEKGVIAEQDSWYQLRGNKTWEESIPHNWGEGKG